MEEETHQDTLPSWFTGSVIPEHTTFKAMMQTPAAPEAIHQHIDGTSHYMIAAQMLLMAMLENGDLTDNLVEKEEAEQLYKSQNLLHQVKHVNTNQLENIVSLVNQKPSSY